MKYLLPNSNYDSFDEYTLNSRAYLFNSKNKSMQRVHILIIFPYLVKKLLISKRV